MSIARRLLTVVVATLIVVVGGGAPALAHNALTGSDPADGATLDDAPDEVRLTFLSSLDPDQSELEVTGPGGRSVRAGEPTFDGRSVLIPVRAEFAGDYRVEFGVLSNDGHWVEGTVGFTLAVGAMPEPSRSPPAAAPGATAPATAQPAPAAAESSGTAAIWSVVALLVIGGLVGLFIGHQWRRRKVGTAMHPST